MRQRRDDHLPVLPWALAGRGRTVLRYSLVSLVSVAVSQSALVVAFGLLHWTARPANVAACAVATVPSYYLNRGWTWGRRGRSRVWKEVVPFWALAFLGLAFSTWAADLGQTLARQAAVSHAATTAIVMTASLTAFGVLWVGKFAILHTVLFSEPSTRPRPTQQAGVVDLEAAVLDVAEAGRLGDGPGLGAGDAGLEPEGAGPDGHRLPGHLRGVLGAAEHVH